MYLDRICEECEKPESYGKIEVAYEKNSYTSGGYQTDSEIHRKPILLSHTCGECENEYGNLELEVKNREIEAFPVYFPEDDSLAYCSECPFCYCQTFIRVVKKISYIVVNYSGRMPREKTDVESELETIGRKCTGCEKTLYGSFEFNVID